MSSHNTEPPLGSVGGVGERVDGRNLQWEIDPPDTGQVNGQTEKVRTTGQGREGPGEGQRKVELVGRFFFLGQEDHGVLEGKQDAGIDIQGQVKIQWSAAPLLGMKVDFPHLAQGVCLYKVSLVVDMEAMVDRVVLQVRHVTGDVNGCHRLASLVTSLTAKAAGSPRAFDGQYGS